MREIDLIILSKAQTSELRNLTCQAIETLLESEDKEEIRFHIQVIESANTGTYNYPFCRTVFIKKSFNYNHFMNLGIKNGNAPYLCLCNNDLIFHRGWASKILNAFENNPELESASPICQINHKERGIEPNTGIYVGYEVRKHVAGWCIFFKRSMIQKTGLLDERFKFWFVDNDYAKTLEKSQISHALVSDSLVDHLESQTLKTKSDRDRLLLTTEARFFFEYKWGYRSYISYLNFKRKQFQKSLILRL